MPRRSGMGLEVEPHVVQRAALAVADGDHEARAGEHHHLADLDRLGAVHVAGGLEHEEQRVAEHLELRALVGVDGVLDRQRVQLEALAHRLDDLGAGVVEADPDEAVAARVGLGERGVELDQAALPVTLVVDAAVHDGRADVLVHVRRSRRPSVAERVAAQQRDPGEAVGRHDADPTPASAPRRERLHAILITRAGISTRPSRSARLAWRACSSTTSSRSSSRPSSSPRSSSS